MSVVVESLVIYTVHYPCHGSPYELTILVIYTVIRDFIELVGRT